MALTANNLIELQNVIDAINVKIRDRIQGRIKWDSEHVPIGNIKNDNNNSVTNVSTGARVSDGNVFKGLAAPRNLNGVSINKSGKLSKFSDIYSSIVSAFSDWSKVRTCECTVHDGRNFYNEIDGYVPSNAEIATTKKVGVGILSSSNNNIIEGIKSKANLLNTLMKVKTTNDFADLIYDTWNTLQSKNNNKVTWEYRICHTNCHGSCHSRGHW